MGALAAMCVRRPVFTWVLVLGLVVLGLASFRGLGLERYPNVDFSFVSVLVAAPGLGAAEVEQEVAVRVEDAIGTVAGLERLDSTSQEGLAIVVAQFSLDRRSEVVAQEVRDKLARLGAELPAAARAPQIEAFNPSAAPVLQIALRSRGGQLGPRALAELADTRVKPALQAVSGVGEVRRFGGRRGQVEVALDPERLLAQNLAAIEVFDALNRENLVAPGGELVEGSGGVALRLAARATSSEALAAVVVARRGERAVRLGDVAEVMDRDELPSAAALIDGDEGVVLGVVRRSGANTVQVVDETRARLAELTAQLPPGVEARVVRDESTPVRASLGAVEEHLVLGAVFASLVVLLFLRSGRATLIAAIAIPASVVGTFAAIKALGLSLNMLTLLGLTLAVGIVIDDAIVVLENVARVLATSRQTPAQAAVEATREIALAVLATTLSLVAVFLPVAFMSGIVGRFLSSFSLTMTVAILLSMLVAFTLTPMLCARWLSPGVAHEGGGQTEGEGDGDEAATYRAWAHGTRREVGDGGQTIESLYGRGLAWVMTRRWVVGVLMAVTLAATVPLLIAVPKTFLPTEDEGRFEVYVRLPEGAILEHTVLEVGRLARGIQALPGVSSTIVTAGSPAGDLSGRGPGEATVFVALARPRIQEATMELVRRQVAPETLPEGSLVLVTPVNDFGGSGPDGAAIQYVLQGPDVDELKRLAGALVERARLIPGTTDHGATVTSPRPQITVRADRERARELGLTQADLAAALPLVGRAGIPAGSLPSEEAGGRSREVVLRLAPGLVEPALALRALTVRAASGALVPLAAVATVQREPTPSQIRRTNRQRQVTVFFNTRPGTSDDLVVAELDRALAELGAPPSYRGEVVGNAREMQKASDAFVTAVTLSVVFMYLILAAQFESWLLPVTILTSLPLTVPFALFSLLAGGQSLNLFSGLGFLVLFGIVKKNAILQVDHTLALRRAGFSRADAVVMANRHRLRPILMTTLAFVAGLVPLVVAGGPGSGVNRAVGIGVLGGQALSLALTLLATPVVYTWLDDLAASARAAHRRLTSAGAP